MIESLRTNLTRLAPRDRQFAESLLGQHDQGRELSAKQWNWVFTLIDRAATDRSKVAPAPSVGDIGRIKGVFEAARDRGWNVDLGLRFLGANNEKVKINPAKSYSANPGCYYVKVNDEYAGKITPSGEFASPRVAEHLASVAVAAVVAYLADPVAAATAYGKKYCTCCFCGRQLDTSESRLVGYGPICADRFGLPWGAKGPKETRHFDIIGDVK